MKQSIDLSIIIVNYKTPALTIACLESIGAAHTEDDAWEILVVDNGSDDTSSQQIKSWLDRHDHIPGALIEMKQNVGFAKANNVAIQNALGKYILLLNSDTEVSSESIRYASQAFRKDKKIGALTVRLELPDGSLDPACHRGFPTPWASFCYFFKLEALFPKLPFFSEYHQYYKDLSTRHEVDAISGAFFLTSKAVIGEAGLLDESFFMYAEDIDWCYRIKAKGYSIIFDPGAEVLHKKKQSGRSHTNKALKKQTQIYFYQTMKQFYDKHYRSRYPGIVSFAVDLGISIRIWITKNL